MHIQHSHQNPEPREPHKLGLVHATAICGNDIFSSVLYVSGISILYSGIFAPLILLSLGLILYLYKKVYTEVVEALPLNGGTYNCLLNGTSKTAAALAGVMTLLSYTATAVISAKVGIEHLLIPIRDLSATLFSAAISPPVLVATIAVLFIFALLVISGVKESARIALVIFVIHIAVLAAFIVLGLLHIISSPSAFAMNAGTTWGILAGKESIAEAIFFAFAASTLGIAGFSSSANFVEEQRKGVFRKTLRNMMLGSVIINPLIAFVVLQSMPIETVAASKDFLLAEVASVIGGTPFQYVIALDAFLVLSGAVLTSYISVSGLLHRMSADNCLPSLLLKQNAKKAYPRIIIGFFLLCSSILLLTRGDLLSLAGMYTLTFLGDMTLFALGTLILREARTELKRTYTTPFVIVIMAFLVTALSLVGNILIEPENVRFFALYFLPTLVIVFFFIHQDYLFRFALPLTAPFPRLHQFLQRHFSDLTDGRFVAFVRSVRRLERIFHYINQNETGWDITLVHCGSGDNEETDESFQEIKRTLPELQKAGFYPHFNLSLVYHPTPFSPKAISEVAHKLKIRRNRIFIGSIHHTHGFDYAEMGGVRIIF